jgi:hypothetical protein
MPEIVVKTVLTDQFLRKEPKSSSDLVGASAGGMPLRVRAGETVKTGSKDPVDETVNGTVTWVFVEATAGDNPDKRKGFVASHFLGAEGTPVEATGEAHPVAPQVSREEFANACYVHAQLNSTNPAYLYALAFAQSGNQWIADTVKTNDAVDALGIGVFQFPKETWAKLLELPEADCLTADDAKLPTMQCIIAAVLAAKSASLLKGLIAGRRLSAVDLYLAHLCADDGSSGSNAAAKILKAEQDNKKQVSRGVIRQIYPNDEAFLKRNKAIFNEDGSATIEEALERCATKLDSGFDKVRELANKIEADVFGDSIPSKPTDPILGGGGASGAAGSVTGVANGIDRRQFLGELANPAIVKKSADMVKGEVGWSAPHDTKLVQLETAFNRAIARGQSLARVLLSTSEDRRLGYYQGGRNGTYSRPVTIAEFDDFKKTILPELLAGSNKSEERLGLIATGNASGSVAANQFAQGTRGGKLDTAVPGQPESYFLEGPLRFDFKRLTGGETIPLPSGLSSSEPTVIGAEPPEQMDGDTEGSGPPGGKFNERPGEPISPPSERQTITLNNGEKVTVNKAVAEQFRGFFNDLIKLGAPIRSLGGFGERPNNASEHPSGFAVDWAQQSRNVVAADVRNWIDSHRDTLKRLEQRWGLSGGENWHNPDTGHFSVERILGAQHLAASRKASETV